MKHTRKVIKDKLKANTIFDRGGRNRQIKEGKQKNN